MKPKKEKDRSLLGFGHFSGETESGSFSVHGLNSVEVPEIPNESKKEYINRLRKSLVQKQEAAKRKKAKTERVNAEALAKT